LLYPKVFSNGKVLKIHGSKGGIFHYIPLQVGDVMTGGKIQSPKKDLFFPVTQNILSWNMEHTNIFSSGEKNVYGERSVNPSILLAQVFRYLDKT